MVVTLWVRLANPSARPRSGRLCAARAVTLCRYHDPGCVYCEVGAHNQRSKMSGTIQWVRVVLATLCLMIGATAGCGDDGPSTPSGNTGDAGDGGDARDDGQEIDRGSDGSDTGGDLSDGSDTVRSFSGRAESA